MSQGTQVEVVKSNLQTGLEVRKMNIYELKKIQIQLMANSNNQGNGNEMIKESTKAAFGDGKRVYYK